MTAPENIPALGEEERQETVAYAHKSLADEIWVEWALNVAQDGNESALVHAYRALLATDEMLREARRERVLNQVGSRKDRWSATSAHATDLGVPRGIHRERTLTRVMETSGFTDCGCLSERGNEPNLQGVLAPSGSSQPRSEKYRPGTVLDPFVGSGTVCLVARKLNRRSIGIDLNESYLEMAARRLQQQSLFAEVSNGV